MLWLISGKDIRNDSGNDHLIEIEKNFLCAATSFVL